MSSCASASIVCDAHWSAGSLVVARGVPRAGGLLSIVLMVVQRGHGETRHRFCMDSGVKPMICFRMTLSMTAGLGCRMFGKSCVNTPQNCSTGIPSKRTACSASPIIRMLQ